jgi:hypothetical protein
MIDAIPSMLTTPVQGQHLLAALSVIALVWLAAWLRLRRREHLLSERLQASEQRLRALQKDVAAMLACSRGLAERVGEQGTHLKLARSAAQAAVPLQRVEASDPQFRSARALILRGASTAEVARTCGLSHGEVELLARITPRVVE